MEVIRTNDLRERLPMKINRLCIRRLGFTRSDSVLARSEMFLTYVSVELSLGSQSGVSHCGRETKLLWLEEAPRSIITRSYHDFKVLG